jgi:energy-converting hydrogenase A subunit N
MSLLQKIKNTVRSRSIHVCYVNTGSCNGCDVEILACLAPRYDLEQYGIYVHNNPREADVLLVTGPVTMQWDDKLKGIWDKMPEPKVAVAIGNCPISGCLYDREGSYVNPPASKYIPIAAEIPGCPPCPREIIGAILSLAPEIFRDYEEKNK